MNMRNVALVVIAYKFGYAFREGKNIHRVYMFDKKGRLIYDDTNGVCTEFYQYDRKGRVKTLCTSVNWYKIEDCPPEEMYTFNYLKKDGKIHQIIQNGDETLTNIYTYDKYGNLLVENSQLENCIISYEYNAHKYNAKPVKYIDNDRLIKRYKYKNNRLVREDVFDERNGKKFKIEYVYENNRLIREIHDNYEYIYRYINLTSDEIDVDLLKDPLAPPAPENILKGGEKSE